MDTSLPLAAALAQSAQTQTALGIAMTKINAQSQQAVVDLLTQSVDSGRQFLAQPAPGTGTVLDKLA